MATRSGSRRLRVVWALSWPAIIEQILSTMVSYVDAAMVGALGMTGSAAVSVNAAPLWLVGGILAGVGTGYAVQVSHAVGAGDDDRAKAVIRQGALAALVCGLAAFALYRALAWHLPMWLGAVEPVLGEAQRYLRVYTYALLFQSFSTVFSGILRCMGNTRTPMALNTGANLLNVVFNFFFIYPTRPVVLLGRSLLLPGAGMGAAGAALGSVLSWVFAGATITWAALRQGERYTIRRGESFRPDRAIIRQAVRLGLPSAAERAMVNIGQVAMTGVVASIDQGVALAANNIAITAEGLCYLPAYGVASAATAMVGQAVGGQEREEARSFGGLSARLGFGICVATALCLFLFAHPLAALFNTDPAVVDEAARMLRIVSVAEPFFALSIVFTGALRGAQDVRFPMVLSLVCMWGARIPLAPLLVYRAGLGLAGVWVAMDVDLILRGALCAWRWRSGRWVAAAFPQGARGGKNKGGREG